MSQKTGKGNRGYQTGPWADRVRKGHPDEKIPALYDGNPVGAGITCLCFRRWFQYGD